MIQTTVLTLPAISAVAIQFPVASVSLVYPSVGIEYPFPVTDWLLDIRGLHARYWEQFSITDTQSLSVDKTLVDGISLDDFRYYDFASTKTEIVSFADSFDRICDFFRDFEEVIGISDTQHLSIDKSINDGFQLSDQRVIDLAKPLSDGIGFSDSFNKTTTKAVHETVGFSDSFYLNGNSYSDVSYFAEDYVGEIRRV